MLRSRKAHSVPLRDHMDALLQFRFMPCPVPIWRPRVGRTHLSESPFDVALASPCGAPRRQVLVGLLQHASLMNSQHRARSKRSGRCRDQEGHEGNSLPASAATSPQPRRLAEHTRYPLRFHCRVASCILQRGHARTKSMGNGDLDKKSHLGRIASNRDRTKLKSVSGSCIFVENSCKITPVNPLKCLT
jgi:hypothetical protein